MGVQRRWWSLPLQPMKRNRISTVANLASTTFFTNQSSKAWNNRSDRPRAYDK
jgi:hypothetical protein